MLQQILLVASFVVSLIAAFWPWPSAPRPVYVHFGWFAISLYLLSILLGKF